MATNWKTPAKEDLAKVMSQLVLAATDANTGPDIQPNQPVNPDTQRRQGDVLALVVQNIRAAIQNSGRVPISLTASSVPPEAEMHALVLAANAMVAATPLTSMVVCTPTGMYVPWKELVADAKKWLEGVNAGNSVTQPSDPVGANGLTAVSSTNLAFNGVRWGDMRGTDTQYEAGQDANGNRFGKLDLTTDG